MIRLVKYEKNYDFKVEIYKRKKNCGAKTFIAYLLNNILIERNLNLLVI